MADPTSGPAQHARYTTSTDLTRPPEDRSRAVRHSRCCGNSGMLDEDALRGLPARAGATRPQRASSGRGCARAGTRPRLGSRPQPQSRAGGSVGVTRGKLAGSALWRPRTTVKPRRGRVRSRDRPWNVQRRRTRRGSSRAPDGVLRGVPPGGARVSVCDRGVFRRRVRPRRAFAARRARAQRSTPPRRCRQRSERRTRPFATEWCPLGTRGEDGNDDRSGRAPPSPTAPCESARGSRTSDHFRYRGKWSIEPLRKQENCATARFLKPSAGLEPATPSLPWQPSQQSQRAPNAERPAKDARTVSRQSSAAPRNDRHLRYPPGTRAADQQGRWQARVDDERWRRIVR